MLNKGRKKKKADSDREGKSRYEKMHYTGHSGVCVCVSTCVSRLYVPALTRHKRIAGWKWMKRRWRQKIKNPGGKKSDGKDEGWNPDEKSGSAVWWAPASKHSLDQSTSEQPGQSGLTPDNLVSSWRDWTSGKFVQRRQKVEKQESPSWPKRFQNPLDLSHVFIW